jgi:hypothetical protein
MGTRRTGNGFDLINFKYPKIREPPMKALHQSVVKAQKGGRLQYHSHLALAFTKSAQPPSASRSHEVRFGARRCARFMMTSWCLTASDSATSAPRPAQAPSFARVTSRWEIKMNSSP